MKFEKKKKKAKDTEFIWRKQSYCLFFLYLLTKMSVECVESMRKPNIDYIINQKKVGNSFAENSQIKRDKLPSIFQNNSADTFDETADTNFRMNTDKKNDSNQTIQSEVNGKRHNTVCYDFKKGICRRRFCRVSSKQLEICIFGLEHFSEC